MEIIMKKIILSTVITTLLISPILAESTSPDHGGFYIGSGFNYTKEKFDLKASFAPSDKSPKLEYVDGGSRNGGGIKLFGGYGNIVYQGLYLGGEVSLGCDRIIGHKNSKELKSLNKMNYGISGRIGYAISNILPYIKVGYEGRPSINIASTKFKRDGFTLGSGVDIALNKSVFIRGEYVHGFGAKTTKSQNDNEMGVNGVTTAILKTSSDTFMLGAAYKF